MKKLIVSFALVLALIGVCCAFGFSAQADIQANDLVSQQVISQETVSAEQTNSAKNQSALQVRFLNMLNHNFVYNSDFDNVEDIVNSSIPALLSLSEQDEDFIAEGFVSDYVFDMYGIEIENFAEINAELPQKEGFVYIVPRGFCIYKHQAISVNENEDGTFTVETSVLTETHDGEIDELNCTTLFVPNNESQFGFNIVYSQII